MEELGWFNHHQQEIEESIMFGSDNIFLNPIQDLPQPGTTMYSSSAAAPTGRQIGSHRQLAPARLDSINVASSFGSASQYWRQTLAVNTLHEGKDDISVIFSGYNNLCNKIIKNNNDVVLSDASVTKLTDDVIDSQCSSEKRHNYSSEFYDDSPPRSKRPRSDPGQSTSSIINFRAATDSDEMKEMVYRAAAFRPVSFSDEEVVEKRRRRNVRISSDPQTVAARRRREKLSERIRVLQKLVPGGNKMDTASMLDEAANYLKFLRSQVNAFEQFGQNFDYVSCGTSTNAQNATRNIIHNNVTLGIPFPMQTPFLLPYPQIYPTLPPA